MKLGTIQIEHEVAEGDPLGKDRFGLAGRCLGAAPPQNGLDACFQLAQIRISWACVMSDNPG